MRMKTVKLCLILLFTIFFTIGNLQAQQENSRAGDEIFMQDLFDATSGVNWHDNSGWNSGSMSLGDNPVGLTIEEINGELRITEVDMQKIYKAPGENTASDGNNLVGTLPESVGNLAKVKKFNVKQNYFTGQIPESIGNMTELVRLSLGGQRGEIDLDWRSEWYSSDHRGVRDGGSGKRYEDTNKFSGDLPKSLGSLPNIELIEIRRQYLTGTLPKEWGEATTLRGILLNNQKGENPLGGYLPPEWGDLVNLSLVKLENHQSSRSDVPQSNGKYTGEIPSSWNEKWSDLANLSVSGNELTGSIPEFLSSRRKRFVSFAGNNFTGEFPMGYFNGDNSNISAFNISDNNLTGEIPDEMVPPIFPSSRSNYNVISVLGIGGNTFTGPIPTWIQEMTGQVQVLFSGIGFTGPFPKTLVEQSKMRLIYLSGNELSGDLPDVNWGKNLYEFIASGNNFTGSIPESWSSMAENAERGVWRFYLNSNELSGEIPSWFAQMHKLEWLYLHNNRFTFKDILPHYDAIKSNLQTNAQNGRSGDAKFFIHDQKPFGSAQSRTMPLGEELVLDLSEFDYEGNRYQWVKNGAPIEGANSPVLILSNVGSADEGDYVLRVTNPALPELETHSSEPITFRIGEDDGGDSDGGDDNANEGDGDDDGDEGGNNSGAKVFPEAPVPYGPDHMEENAPLTPEFKWSTVEGADYYVLHVARVNPSGMTLDVIVEDTTYTPSEILGESSIHDWRVFAIKDGEESERSEIRRFTTNDANLPGMADLVAPSNFSENIELTPELVWEEIDADSYLLRILEKESGDVTQNHSSNTNTFQLEGELMSETEYVWQVKSVKNGIEGAWGPRWEFTTGTYSEDAVVETPYLLSPDQGVEHVSLQPEFEWADVDADYYILTVQKTDTVHAKSNMLLLQNSVIYAETEGQVYTPEDPLEVSTLYYWRVKAVKNGVEGEWSEQWEFRTPGQDIVTSNRDLGDKPLKTDLKQNYPNPFNPTTQIVFTLAESGNVSLKVYNLAGQLVETLLEGALQAGSHTARFDASNLASGVYFYRLVSGSQHYTERMTLIK